MIIMQYCSLLYINYTVHWSPGLTCLVVTGYYPERLISSLPPPTLALDKPPFCSVLRRLAFLDSIYKWDHTVFTFLWFISLRKMPSGSFCVVVNGRISSFLWMNYVSLYVPHLLCPFISWWAFGFFHMLVLWLMGVQILWHPNWNLSAFTPNACQGDPEGNWVPQRWLKILQ